MSGDDLLQRCNVSTREQSQVCKFAFKSAIVKIEKSVAVLSNFTSLSVALTRVGLWLDDKLKQVNGLS